MTVKVDLSNKIHARDGSGKNQSNVHNSGEIFTVDATNVDQQGFFCYRNGPNTSGYERNQSWLRRRFFEGMKIKILSENAQQVGFIEYIPGEYAWRAVHAENYMVIHSLWVVGRAKEQGYGSRLIKAAMEDARTIGLDGVAMVTNNDGWLADKEILLQNGFEIVDQAPPSFELLVKKFQTDAPSPAFPTNWAHRLARCGNDLVVFRADQYPYMEKGIRVVEETCREMGIDMKMATLESSREVRNLAPSASGVFNVVYNGQLLSTHYLSKNELRSRLDAMMRPLLVPWPTKETNPMAVAEPLNHC